jgi:hypothetical protein
MAQLQFKADYTLEITGQELALIIQSLRNKLTEETRGPAADLGDKLQRMRVTSSQSFVTARQRLVADMGVAMDGN